MSTLGAPSPRDDNTAIWTGSELIVWGGNGLLRGSPDDSLTSTKSPGKCTCTSTSALNDGARYNPVTDTWKPISTIAAPSAIFWFTAVWTGQEMIVWGGNPDVTSTEHLTTGGRYNPATDTWTPVSTAGAPTARIWHTAVWTGKEMIVWGGILDEKVPDNLNIGGRYNPATDTWSTLPDSGAPCPRFHHAAIWTGSEMIIWGGSPADLLVNCPNFYHDAGARYTPPE